MLKNEMKLKMLGKTENVFFPWMVESLLFQFGAFIALVLRSRTD